jgi:hypothetical protein
MLADVGQYLWDLADNWAAFMTGGIPAALILIVERLRRKQLPLRTFVIFLAFGFVAASYQAHNHLNGELKKTKVANESLKGDLKIAGDQAADVRRQLAEANKWIPLASRPTPGPASVFYPGSGLSYGITVRNFEMEGGKRMIGVEGPLANSTFENLKAKGVDHGIDFLSEKKR